MVTGTISTPTDWTGLLASTNAALGEYDRVCAGLDCADYFTSDQNAALELQQKVVAADLARTIELVIGFAAKSPEEREAKLNITGSLFSISARWDQSWLESLADEILLSEGEVPDIDFLGPSLPAFIATRALHSPWPMGQRFWDVFSVYDPLHLMAFRMSTPCAWDYLCMAVEAVRLEKPADAVEFAEKLKIAICIGAVQFLAMELKSGALSDEDPGHLRVVVGDLIATPSVDLLGCLQQGVADIELPNPVSGGDLPATLYRQLLGVTSNAWRATLQAEAIWLGLLGATSSGSS